jgi:general secretion pathway protein E
MDRSRLAIPFSYAKAHRVVLVENEQGNVLYYSPPLESSVLLEVMRFVNTLVDTIELSAEKFQTLLTTHYDAHGNTAQMALDVEEDLELNTLIKALPKQTDLLDQGEEAPIIRLLNALLSQSIKQRASDIHIEVFEEGVVIRFRVDGFLQEVLRLQRVLAPFLISRIKIMAQLDIAEKRLPQDGRISLRLGGRSLDVRVSVLPTAHGERIVMRILDKHQAQLDLEQLGMSEKVLADLLKIIQKPHGILLVTGPTGAGKTTTLYAALTRLNEVSRNILTVEDPIEYDLPGIGQTQVNLKVDLSFSRGLRSILRQDPDVVMVGEIRDVDTAKVAVQASLTGHLVLSTLHTNSAIGAVTRLRDMGIESFLLASSLIGLASQRLVRLLCESCKEACSPSETEAQYFSAGGAPAVMYKAQGCEACHRQGYRGRIGIYEVVPIDDQLRQLIHDNQSESQLRKAARMLSASIESDGLRLVKEGKTSLEEVLRVTQQRVEDDER